VLVESHSRSVNDQTPRPRPPSLSSPEVNVNEGCANKNKKLFCPYLKSAPLSVLDTYQFVRETQVVGELFQEVDTEAGTALVHAAVVVSLGRIRPAAHTHTLISFASTLRAKYALVPLKSDSAIKGLCSQTLAGPEG